jgi:hypothetical protein
VTLNHIEKRGGSFVKDPFRENMEDLLSTWDLVDIKPIKGLCTCSNKRIGLGNIITCLDHFYIQRNFLLTNNCITSNILHKAVSNHSPIVFQVD